MSSVVLAIFALVFLVLGYFTYGTVAARVFGVDSSRITPALSKRDGVDYQPAKNWLVLYGHHFSSIAGAAPIIGPVVALALWGWLPALVWILVGSVFMGGVHDLGSLMVSLRHGGESIAGAAEALISRWAKILFSGFVLLALVLVIAVFAVLAAKSIVQEPGVSIPAVGLIPLAVGLGFLFYKTRIPGWISTLGGLLLLSGLIAWGGLWPPSGVGPYWVWLLGLLIYALVASITPVQFLLQPRDYMSAFLLFAGIAIGYIGIFYSHKPVVVPAFKGFVSSGPLWPMLFVTIACGAISGFHSLIASGTTSKQLATEAHAKRIGYGGMLGEGLLSAMTVVLVASFATAGFANPISDFGKAYDSATRGFLFGHGGTFGVLILNAFILTTLDTATRIGRYIAGELFGLRNRWMATLVVLIPAGILAFTGSWKQIWPLFGAANQLVAGLALLVVSAWLLARGKGPWLSLAPGLFMLLTTVVALLWQAWGFLRGLSSHPVQNSVLLVLDIVLTVLAVAMVILTARAWKEIRTKRARA